MAKLILRLTDYLRYLRLKGLEGKGRKSGSHERWNYPEGQKQLLRSLTVDHHYRDIPEAHMRSNGMSMGMTWEQVYADMVKHKIVKLKGVRQKPKNKPAPGRKPKG